MQRFPSSLAYAAFSGSIWLLSLVELILWAATRHYTGTGTALLSTSSQTRSFLSQMPDDILLNILQAVVDDANQEFLDICDATACTKAMLV
jgi:hypothetical protein